MDPCPLIQVDELQGLLAGSEVCRPVVLDVRYRMGSSNGRRDFEVAHVPGATYLDMDTALTKIRADGAGGRHPMPPVETFATAMRSAGVTTSRPVVAYDDWSSLPASRVWWMLRHFGFLAVRVLDGGIASWTASGQPTESGPSTPGAGDFSPTPPGADAFSRSRTGVGHLLEADAARSYAARHLLLDARPADRFRGENETIDPVAGHIPGTVSAPALANVDQDGRFLPAHELAARLLRLGAGGATKVGTYCGSGIQATHLALALSIAGISDAADVYIGSWSDWITDPARPVEV